MNTLKRILKGILKFCGICLLIFLAMCAYSIIKYSGKYRNKAAASSVSAASSIAASESISSSATSAASSIASSERTSSSISSAPSESPESIAASLAAAVSEVEPFMLDASILTTNRTGRKVEAPGLSLSYGEIENLTVGGACDGQIVLKVQAFPVSDSERRAFESIRDLILNHGFDACRAIDYWAVNPTSGNKFLSFSLDSTLISKIASGSIGAEEMAGEVSDLWVDSSVVQ